MTSSRIFRPVSGPNPARKNSAKNAPVLCQIRHAPGHSLFSFCVKKGLQNGPYSQLHFCGFKPSHALSIPAYRLHIADIPPTRSSPTAILIYPDPLYRAVPSAPPALSPFHGVRPRSPPSYTTIRRPQYASDSPSATFSRRPQRRNAPRSKSPASPHIRLQPAPMNARARL